MTPLESIKDTEGLWEHLRNLQLETEVWSLTVSVSDTDRIARSVDLRG